MRRMRSIVDNGTLAESASPPVVGKLIVDLRLTMIEARDRPMAAAAASGVGELPLLMPELVCINTSESRRPNDTARATMGGGGGSSMLLTRDAFAIGSSENRRMPLGTDVLCRLGRGGESSGAADTSLCGTGCACKVECDAVAETNEIIEDFAMHVVCANDNINATAFARTYIRFCHFR